MEDSEIAKKALEGTGMYPMFAIERAIVLARADEKEKATAFRNRLEIKEKSK